MTTFIGRFRRVPDTIASAPGRVNLIGEHTDYNEGYVLPVALSRRTTVTLARRGDSRVRVWSDMPEARVAAQYAVGAEARRGDWLDYVAGVTWVLRNAGLSIGGFDARVSSTVPPGRGLASSAALTVAVLRALRQAFGLPLDDVTLARLAQRVENDFVGAPVGIMDQMAASLGDAASALFLDARTLAWERVPQPPAIELAIVDSGISHRHAGGDYGRRRAECEEAARLLGVRALRDLSAGDLERAERLPPPLGRRVRHVVTENERVIAMVHALRADDPARCGGLLDAAHASLRDDFEVSLPAIDRLVAAARRQPDAYGARLTGGGFGGAIVVLTRAGRGGTVARAAAAAVPDITAAVIMPTAA
jgi:galactokinase